MLPVLTLGGNQVGKAAICGWKDVLAPALRSGKPISLWPFDGALPDLLMPGTIVVAETYPAECYGWFCEEEVSSKGDRNEMKKFGALLIPWAEAHEIKLGNCLAEETQAGFPQGDDAFDAVVGLFGMLQVCLGQRPTGEPNEAVIHEIEGWILGPGVGT